MEHKTKAQTQALTRLIKDSEDMKATLKEMLSQAASKIEEINRKGDPA